MSQTTKSKVEEILVPERCIVHEHPESKAKYTAFPFVFPDGYPATLVITRGTKGRWMPSEDIEKIVIHYK